MIGALFWIFAAIIVYTYAGYPLIVALLAKLVPRRLRLCCGSIQPTVTLLITAYNEEAWIEAKLENALALDYPPERLQILVTDDGSEDRTAEIVRRHSHRGVELMSLPHRCGKTAAMGRIISCTRGEILVFSDADNLYKPDALREIVIPFADPGVGGVSGAKLVQREGALSETEGIYWKYESFIKRQESILGSCAGAAGDMFAIRRALFTPPPETIINDDFYLLMDLVRRGHRVVYAPRARVVHRVAASQRDEIERRARIVAGRYQALSLAPRLLPRRGLLLWQVISHKFLRLTLPWLMAGALGANAAAVVIPMREGGWIHLAPPLNWILLGLQVAFYVAALVGAYLERHGMVCGVLYLPAFLVKSNWAAVVGLHRFLTRQQTPLWQRVNRRAHNT